MPAKDLIFLLQACVQCAGALCTPSQADEQLGPTVSFCTRAIISSADDKVHLEQKQTYGKYMCSACSGCEHGTVAGCNRQLVS